MIVYDYARISNDDVMFMFLVFDIQVAFLNSSGLG